MIWIVLLMILLILFLVLCHVIGSKFLSNLKRKNPGEKFTANMDISFYKNGPLNKIAQEGLAYMDTLKHEDVYINTFDGLKLHATLFPTKDNNKKFVLGIHGFQSHAYNEFAPHIKYYLEHGYSMLLPDDRAHGTSEGQYITMGVKDRLDCVEWAKYLVSRFGDDISILLHGVSMGAASVISASGEDELPKQVIGVISDCGFTSVEESLNFQMKNLFNMPSSFPLKVCRYYAKHKAGFDFDEGRPIDLVKKTKIPVLFVQGVDDIIVPKFMAEKLYDACNSKKELLMVEHANHAESIAVNPSGYHEAMHRLFNV